MWHGLNANTFFLKIFSFLIICSPGLASFEDLGIGARQQGMGETYVGLANFSDAVFGNPAGLAEIQALQSATYYSRPFGLKELAHHTFSLAIPVRNWGAGIGLQTFGYSAYRENSYTFAVAGRYAEKLSFGFSLKYLSLSIINYGSDGTIGLDAGLQVKYSSRLVFGFVTKNWNRPQLGHQKQYLPQIFVSGFLFQPHPNLNLTFDIYKDIRFPLDPRAGIEYCLLQRIYLRAGTAWDPARHSLGFGLKSQYFQIDYAFYSHSTLNLTHLFSVTFSRTPARPQLPEVTEPEPLQPEKEKKPSKPGKLKTGESINVNTAGVEELCRLPGIGKSVAEAIIKYRETRGEFVTLTELTQIKGIGSSKFKKLLPFLRLKD